MYDFISYETKFIFVLFLKQKRKKRRKNIMKRTFVTNLSYLNSADLSSLEKLEKSDKIIVFSNEDDFGISIKQFSALSSTKA